MRQWVAAVLVAGAIAAPALRTLCEFSCAAAADEATAVVPSCHETELEPAAVSLGATDECGDHAQPAAVTAVQKDRAPLSNPIVQLPIALASVAPPSSRGEAASIDVRGSTSPPIPPGTNILRV